MGIAAAIPGVDVLLHRSRQLTPTDIFAPRIAGYYETKDVLGNLTTVVEPDPNNQPGGTLTTSYTYNWMNEVTQVSMPRGSTTQTRAFVYDAGAPELDCR
jgi:hypothetical protein